MNNRRIIGLSLVIMLIILELCVQKAYSEQLSGDASKQYPHVYEDRIVFVDFRNGNADIYLYNITSQIEYPICTNKSTQLKPALYKDKIVWQDLRDGSGYANIIMFDLSNSSERVISNATRSQEDPKIFDNFIVWTDYRNQTFNGDIYCYNLGNSTEMQITRNTALQAEPDIYKTKIVWTDTRYDEDGDIFMCDLNTRVETQLTTSTLGQYHPKIYGNYVVWEDARHSYKNIYMMNLLNMQEIQLTNATSDQVLPAVFEDKVVWIDRSETRFALKLYNISAGAYYSIFAETNYPYTVSIHSNYIVWDDDIDRNGKFEIHYYELTKNSDNDTIYDYADEDDDNDGYNDMLDAFPLDPEEWEDTDSDGIGNNADNDDDNDGLNDTYELSTVYNNSTVDWNGDGTIDYKTDPLNPDSDNDTIIDGTDSKPLVPNLRPVAEISAEKIVLSVYEKNQFYSQSYDTDGTVTSYYFDFGDGKNSGWIHNSTVTHEFRYAGLYYVSLKVKDNLDVVSINNVYVPIVVGLSSANNNPPQIAIAVKSRAVVNETVYFQSSAWDVDGRVIYYQWDFDGDGNFDWNSTESGNTSFKYTLKGTYKATLRVYDNLGGMNEKSIIISVSEEYVLTLEVILIIAFSICMVILSFVIFRKRKTKNHINREKFKLSKMVNYHYENKK